MMRLFELHRAEDVHGVSGTGTVAEGVEFSNGRVAIEWLTSTPSTNIYDNIKQVDEIHGHEGRTKVVWL
jgi:hypothetical protein